MLLLLLAHNQSLTETCSFRHITDCDTVNVLESKDAPGMSRCWIHTDVACWRQTSSPQIGQRCCLVRSNSNGRKLLTQSEFRLSSPFCEGRLRPERQDSNDHDLPPLEESRVKQAEQNPWLYQGRTSVACRCQMDSTGQGRIWCLSHCMPINSTKHLFCTIWFKGDYPQQSTISWHSVLVNKVLSKLVWLKNKMLHIKQQVKYVNNSGKLMLHYLAVNNR